MPLTDEPLLPARIHVNAGGKQLRLQDADFNALMWPISKTWLRKSPSFLLNGFEWTDLTGPESDSNAWIDGRSDKPEWTSSDLIRILAAWAYSAARQLKSIREWTVGDRQYQEMGQRRNKSLSRETVAVDTAGLRNWSGLIDRSTPDYRSGVMQPSGPDAGAS